MSAPSLKLSDTGQIIRNTFTWGRYKSKTTDAFCLNLKVKLNKNTVDVLPPNTTNQLHASIDVASNNASTEL